MKNVLAIFDDDNAVMSRSRIIGEAHILGSIHTARASLDIFAQLVNLLVLNQALSIDRCNIHKMLDELPASTLKSHLAALLDADAFKYIAAFINVTKHRQLVRHALTVSMDEDRVGIRIGGRSNTAACNIRSAGAEVLEASLAVKNGLVGAVAHSMTYYCALPRHHARRLGADATHGCCYSSSIASFSRRALSSSRSASLRKPS